jgi:predicted heme/steroid binding protein
MKSVLLAALLAALTVFVLFAQSDLGSISGFVRDPTSASVPNATVTVKNEATGTERRVTTDRAGYYVVTNIPAGYYSIAAEATGFKKYETAHNKLDPAANLAIDAPLTVGAASETVEVTASAPPLQSESAAVQKLITREQIDMLELNGRNPVGLAGMVPGARGGTLASLNFNLSQGPSNFNGSRNPENLITIDGAPATRTRSNGASIGAADVDSTQEVQILTANYNAEYGRTSGAQIRIITKSGGQQFHGALYEYLRNTDLNANTWARNNNPVTSSAAPVHYNQYGYNVGGPFYIPGKFNTDKSKFFWYWGQEWVKYHWTESGSTVGSAGLLTVPSALMRVGDFSELLDLKNIFYGKTMIIKDPNTGVPFPNNVIPKNMLSPNGLGILNAWPVPNLANPIGGNGNWFAAALHTQEQRKDTLAADMNLTDKQRITFRRQNFAYLEYQPLDGNTDRTPKFFNRPNQTNSLDHVWTITPNMVNEVLATVSLDDVYIPVDTAHYYDRTKAGLNYPYIFPDGKLIQNRIPSVNMSPFSGLSGGPYPSHSTGPIYDISDSLTWIKGNHTMKFGFLYERSGENDNDEINVSACPTCTNNQNGQFLFTDSRSGNPTSGVGAANAALGLFDTYSEIGHRAYTIFRGSMSEAFAQDSWKVTSKLHVDYGIRYSVIVPYSALWRNMAVFDPGFYDPSKAVKIDPKTGNIVPGAGGDPYNGLVIPGSAFPSSAKGRFPEADSTQFNYLFRGVNSHYSDIQWNDWQPRLGVAYQVDSKTVVRAGGGRFVTRLGVSDSIFLGGNPPFQPNASVSFGSVDNPGGNGALNIPLVVTTQSKAFKNPEAWNWNITAEREMFWKSVLTLAYVGRRGLHLQRESDINQPTTATVLANPGVNINALRPYLGYGSIRETDNVANSRYNSFQLTWNRRFANGFMFGVSYTLSKSYDDGSNQRDVIPDTYNAHNLWGPSEFDARHILVINYLYDLPFLKGQSNLAGKLLGGWQISGVTQFQTGLPCGVAGSNDYAGVGQDANYGCGVNGQYFNINGNPAVLGQFAANGANDPAQWFATKNADGTPIFTPPAAGTFNTTQSVRGLIYQPGFQNWNLGLFKKFAINERTGFQFRAEAFNFINHPNLGGGSGGGVQFNPTSSTFGKVTTKGGGVGGGERNLQLSLRYYF